VPLGPLLLDAPLQVGDLALRLALLALHPLEPTPSLVEMVLEVAQVLTLPADSLLRRLLATSHRGRVGDLGLRQPALEFGDLPARFDAGPLLLKLGPPGPEIGQPRLQCGPALGRQFGQAPAHLVNADGDPLELLVDLTAPSQ